MVDITGKAPSSRRAVAWCRIQLGEPSAPTPARRVSIDAALVQTAQISGVRAAKHTATLIPLCHPLPVDEVSVEVRVDGDAVEITTVATTWARTGIEMEAMVACAVAALTVIDGAGAHDCAHVESLTLLEKSGGRSGSWTREKPSAGAPGPPVHVPTASLGLTS
jgi:cyclic pyranopterin phosphate synthase